MHTDWQAFLTDRGAEFDDGVVRHYGNPAREQAVVLSGNILCDLSHYAIIAVSGEDATDFLHNLFINDIKGLQEGRSQLNGFCNPKGRLMANFRVFRIDDTWYLRLPAEVADDFLKRLSMFVLRSKVSISNASNDFIRIGYSGRSADQELGAVVDSLPQQVDALVRHDGLTIIRIPGITPSYEIYGDVARLKDIWTRLDVRSAPVGKPAWDLIEILTGIPHITGASVEQFVPQMVNAQAIAMLSFTKGCYPGQEIVARMHYLGKLKKRMYLARVRSDSPPAEGQPLSSDDKTASAGNILNVALHPDGDYAVLAVIQIQDAEHGPIHLQDKNGPVLELQELPYAVELKEEK